MAVKKFVSGHILCEGFFNDAARPVLDKHFPDLKYTAGLLGYGSDVIGYDDCVSTDHMWGPRFYLFLSAADMPVRSAIEDCLAQHLPYEYKGYSVNFSAPDPNDNGVRVAEMITAGRVSPLIFYNTIESYINYYLGKYPPEKYDLFDWITFSQHKLLSLTKARLYRDDLHLAPILAKLIRFPKEVKLYLTASQWAVISQEQAFVKRTFARGDETGSRIIASRICERLMRLCFLYCDEYAPYSKWFGTAFAKLNIPREVKSSIKATLYSNTIADIEKNLVSAQCWVGALHNQSGLTQSVEISPQSYFGRDIKVIYADRIADEIRKQLCGTPLENAPLIGGLDEVGNFTEITDDCAYREKIRRMYIRGE